MSGHPTEPTAAIVFENRVAIITGAAQGLGRSHAKALAARGVKVVVNDLEGTAAVVDEIKAGGGVAIGVDASVTDEAGVADMVAKTIDAWGKIDILVNNAGILRDKTFAKMTLDDFRLVVEVHLIGSAICTKAVWDHMKDNGYGRIAMTTSSSGMYGNFGQSNYGAAKAGLTGLMNTLCLEGAKYNIRVNTLSPMAHTQMTENLLPPEALALSDVESVSQGLVYLVCDEAPNRIVLVAGASGYAATRIFETDGVTFTPGTATAERVAGSFDKILDMEAMKEMISGAEQGGKLVPRAAALKG